MIICNVKLNKKAIFKTCLGIMFIVCIAIGIAALYNILNKMEDKNNTLIEDAIPPSSDVAQIKPENYTNILKAVHNNIDTYIGQKISFSGYVYRVVGFTEKQFVLARDMDIGNNQTLIVGFLCESEHAQEFENYTWVNLIGEITKGYYNNADVPIIKVTAIENTNKPENATVCLPDDAYVPTAVIY